MAATAVDAGADPKSGGYENVAAAALAAVTSSPGDSSAPLSSVAATVLSSVAATPKGDEQEDQEERRKRLEDLELRKRLEAFTEERGARDSPKRNWELGKDSRKAPVRSGQ